MSARLTIDARAFAASLRQTIDDRLKPQAARIIADAARAQAQAMASAYPVGPTGNLREGVSSERTTPFRHIVRNRAPHAHLYEHGTGTRRTRKGWHRGAMPAQHVWIPSAVRERTQMEDDLQALMDQTHEV
jgi:hypothetical protein